jgi:hypothetical protein
MIGFIKNLISGIVNFFSGIVSFIFGLFGGKQDSFYLELKEDSEEKLENTKKAALNAKKAVETTASKVAETATTNSQKVAETVTSNAKKAVETIVENSPETANGKQKSTAKSKVKSAKEVQLVQTAQGVQLEPAKKAKAPTPEQPTETTFAPKYLIPTSSNGRRRPGANMNSFLDMARQVKPQG